jgi:hypothetical protein
VGFQLRTAQMVYLQELQKRQKTSASEMARLSRVLADKLQQPGLAFKQQAAWSWFKGTRSPGREHRMSLAMIFRIPLEDLERGLDGPVQVPDTTPIVRPVVIQVRRNDREFEYHATVKGEIDLGRPAIYKNWEDMFRPTPLRLQRHFKGLQCSLFGWVPDKSLSPLVRYSRSLVPLNEERLALGDENNVDKRIWFVYLPGEVVDFGIAFQEGRWLHLSRPNLPGAPVQRILRSRVDLVGYVVGKVLFHLDLL